MTDRTNTLIHILNIDPTVVDNHKSIANKYHIDWSEYLNVLYEEYLDVMKEGIIFDQGFINRSK